MQPLTNDTATAKVTAMTNTIANSSSGTGSESGSVIAFPSTAQQPHTLSAPPKKLQSFQLTFGDYLRRQFHDEVDKVEIDGEVNGEFNNQVDDKIDAMSKVASKTASETNHHDDSLHDALHDDPDGNQSKDIADDIPKRVGQLYQSLIFNNLKGFINQCLPVCQTLMTAEEWQALTLYFFQNGDLHSPYFTEINKHFVDFLYTLSAEQRASLNVPDYLADLAHYEWIELVLDIYPDTKVYAPLYPGYVLNINLKNLHYQWQVHRISEDNLPTEAEDTFLLVYRTPTHHIEFMEVNALTHLLIEFMLEHSTSKNPTKTDEAIEAIETAEAYQQDEQAKPRQLSRFNDARALLTQFFASMDTQVEPQVLDFGEQLLQQLIEQQVLLPLAGSAD